MGTSRYSLRTVTVPSGPFVARVEWFPPADVSHLIVAAGLPSAASHWATTTDLEPAWTVTTLAEFLGLAGGGTKRRKKSESDVEISKSESGWMIGNERGRGQWMERWKMKGW